MNQCPEWPYYPTVYLTQCPKKQKNPPGSCLQECTVQEEKDDGHFCSCSGAGPAPAWGPEAIAPDWENREDSPGTTLMAVQVDGGMVLGAGSRATTGSYIAKLTPIQDHIFCCSSASAADTQAGADTVTYQLGFHSIELNEPPLVHTVASLLKEICH